jgi:D-alanine-D-alanine ligase
MPAALDPSPVAVLHQGQPDSRLPTVHNAWRLQQDLCAALAELGWRAEPVFLDDDFRWLRRLLDLAPGVVFNAADLGFFDDISLEPHIGAVLEATRLRFTGSGVFAASLSGDKYASKVFLRSLGIAVPRCWLRDQLDAADLTYPLILKPRFGHNSYGMSSASVIGDRDELTRGLAGLSPDAPEPILEEFVDGDEVVAGFLGDSPRQPMPQFRIEYGPSFAHRPKILDYRAKWLEASEEYRDSMPVPAGLPPELAAELDRAVQTTADRLLIHDYARCDFRIRRNPGGPAVAHLIDVNTNPDLSRTAGMFRMAAAAGLSYAGMVERIVRSALARPLHAAIVDRPG